MVAPLLWLIVLEAVGLAAVPLAFSLFRWLPDRGWSLSKPLGLLLVSYLWWLLGLTQVVPNTLWTGVGALLAVGVASWWVARRRWRDMAAFVRAEAWTIALIEAVVLAFFLGWVLIRAHTPEIRHTEQPMDFAFLNAVIRSPFFPPNDPWLSGFHVSYYYFGYLMMGGLTVLSGVGSAVGYNLALATLPALSAAAAFGLVYNLVRLGRGSPDAGAVAGLGAAVLLAVAGNLEGVLEFVRARGRGSAGFWQWVGIQGLSGPATPSSGWYSPDTWWWFRASRVIPGAIAEFPAFSFVLGDLHPHVMSLPFLLLALGAILNVYASDGPTDLAWLRRYPGQALGLALAIGALPAINMWDLPTAALLLAVALAVKARASTAPGSIWRALRQALTMATPVLVAALVLFFPFYLTFTSQASGVLPVRKELTRPFYLLLIWGPFLFLTLSFLGLQWGRLYRSGGWGRPLAASAALAMVPVLVWVLVEGGARLLTGDLAGAPGAIGRRALQALPFGAVIAAAGAGALARAPREKGGPTAFALSLMAVGYLLILGPELFFLLDFFGNRMNTVFKLYYQAWTFLAIASGYGLYYLHSRWGFASLPRRLVATGWWAVAVVLGVAVLYYPAGAIASRVAEGGPTLTLNGLAHVARGQAGEYAAIRWLWQNASRDAVVLEAVGNDYSEFGRVAASTGNPTVIGWIGHELQWRGSSRSFDGRPEEVREVYQTGDLQRARALLDKYSVQFVVVGSRERQQYGGGDMSKFDRLGTPVVSQDGVTLYRVER